MDKGKIFTAFFFTIWCGAAFGMGIWILQIFPFGTTSAPLIIQFMPVVMPFVMGTIGLCVCVSVLRSKPPEDRQESVYPSESMVYTGDYVSEFEMPEERERSKPAYKVPSQCPSCGAAISNDNVNWVGPLQARCPYCSAIFDAEQ